jgi:hypothetical protein
MTREREVRGKGEGREGEEGHRHRSDKKLQKLGRGRRGGDAGM